MKAEVTRPAKVLTLPFSVILRPGNQCAVGVEGQLQHLVVVAASGGLARAEAMVAAIVGHAAIEAGTDRGLDKPFGHDFAITESGLPVRWTEFGHRLGIRVMPDAAVPVNWRWRLAAGEKRDGQGQDNRQ